MPKPIDPDMWTLMNAPCQYQVNCDGDDTVAPRCRIMCHLPYSQDDLDSEQFEYCAFKTIYGLKQWMCPRHQWNANKGGFL